MPIRQVVLATLSGLLSFSAASSASKSAPDELVSITIAGDALREVLARLKTDYGYAFAYPPFALDRRGPHLYIEPTPATSAMQRMAEAYGLCSRVLVGFRNFPKFVMLKECEEGEFGYVQEPFQGSADEGTEPVWLGVKIRDAEAQATSGRGERGVFVGAFTEERTVAEAAGVQVGDVIVAYNGIPVTGGQHFAMLVSKSRPGDGVPIAIVRDDRQVMLIAQF